MSSVNVVLPDGKSLSLQSGARIIDVAEKIGPGLAKATLGGIVNDEREVSDLRREVRDGDRIRIITAKDPEGLEVLRHSCAHLMAQAVQDLWPDVKVTIGPVIENGFYYDFDSPRPFRPEDLEKVEQKMKEIVKRDEKVVREMWPTEKAIEVFSSMGEKFKVEIIRDLGVPEVSIYRQGEWMDLCRGPHVQSMGQIKAFKVLSTAGAYWRGDEKNAQLQRIYGTAFADKKDLEQHLNDLEEAKKRDHRKVGKELGLFMFHDWTPGAPFFSPKGAVIYNELVNYIRQMYRKYGYEEVITPQIFDLELYKSSGHYDNYADNMYFAKLDEDRITAVKPMNCPGHCLMFGAEKHSYRDLPLRIADFGRLHRFEKSGALHGLTRVRSMAQDDAHIFCREDQVQAEIESFITMLNEVYTTLGLREYTVLIATRPEKRMGSDEDWDKAEQSLIRALENLKIPFEISPGEGAFYGPKVEVHVVDAIRRSWQLGTIQVDFNMPRNFHLKYTGEDNADHTPVMLHRAVLGSLERFIGLFIEHTAGRFPLWLCPIQVVVMNVSEKQEAYAQEVSAQLKEAGLRVQLDIRNEKLGYKIREWQLQKVPYMLTLGDKEKEAGTLSLRTGDGSTEYGLSLQSFVERLTKEIQEKSLGHSKQ
jgi:threonyl-tRNA synthetase